MFELPKGLRVVGDAPVRSQSQSQPQFRNRLEQREWEAAQSKREQELQSLPQGLRVIDTQSPTVAPIEPMFIPASQFQPSMAQALRSGQLFLCNDEGDRDLAIAEFKKTGEVPSRARAISDKWALLHRIGSDLPAGLRVVG